VQALNSNFSTAEKNKTKVKVTLWEVSRMPAVDRKVKAL
jgi:hypothetical protein